MGTKHMIRVKVIWECGESLDKYILTFAIWANIFSNLDKCSWQFGQIVYWNKTYDSSESESGWGGRVGLIRD